MDVKNILQDNKEEIINLRKNGMYVKDIAGKYGLKTQTVYSFLIRNGIRIRKALTDEDILDICSSYTSGEKVETISRRHHIDNAKTRSILREHGIYVVKQNDIRKYTLDETYFDKIDTANKAYILGLLYSDGNNRVDNHCIRISLQEGDVDILKKIQLELNSNAPLVFKDNLNIISSDGLSRRSQYCLTVCSKYMSDRLVELGVVPNKSLIVTYPNLIKDEFVKDFIRGYLDGDGSISNLKQAKVSFTGCYDLFVGFDEAIYSHLGFRGHFYHCKNKAPSTYSYVFYGEYNTRKLLKWLYDGADLFMQRKYNIFLNRYNNNLELSA